jgi:hypothetical protein
MFIKNSTIFHCKTFQNLPKFGFLVCKYTIWQNWTRQRFAWDWHFFVFYMVQW